MTAPLRKFEAVEQRELTDAASVDSPSECTRGGVSRQGLWTDFRRSVRDNAIAEVACQALRIGGMIFLARALRPADFGLFKVLMVVVSISSLFCESGVPDALIQRRELRPEHEATGWWWSIGSSLGCAAVLFIAAPFIAEAMKMQELTAGIRLLCLPLALDGSSVCAGARLRRELKFGALAAADVLSEVAFLAAALILLWEGYPLLTLPGALATRVVVHGLVVWAADPKVPRGMPTRAAATDLGQFAGTVLGGRIITVLSGNIDYLLVGRILGTGPLGFYAMAWDLLRFVPDRLYRIAGRVAFPTFSKLQDDDEELARAYRNFINYISRLVLPMAACASLAAPELIESIYGPKWIPAAMPMRLLAAGLALAGLRIGIGTVYYSKNYPSVDIYLNGLRFLLLAIGVTLTAPYGLVAVSGTVCLIESAASIVGQVVVCRLVGMRFVDLAASAIPGAKLAGACLIATAAGKVLGDAADIRAPFILAFVVIPPALAFAWLEAGEVSLALRQSFGLQIAAKVVEVPHQEA